MIACTLQLLLVVTLKAKYLHIKVAAERPLKATNFTLQLLLMAPMKERYLSITIAVGASESMEFYIIIAVGGPF